MKYTARAARIHFVDNVNGEPILHYLAILRVVAPTRDAAAAAAAALIRRLAEVMAATARPPLVWQRGAFLPPVGSPVGVHASLHA
jgi:hypothetical protein